ncbi:MAG: outer membrane beta-barrel domain-containing protein [Pseudomonadota bacterium]
MESRIQFLSRQALGTTLALAGIVLAAALFASDATAATADDLELDPLIVREPERRTVRVEKIDSENFEIGAFGGVLSVEDFGSNAVFGVRAAYHLSEDFFVEASYADSKLGQTSFEQLSGGAQLLTDDQRDFRTYNVGIGINVLPGESFIASRWAFKGGLYLIAGVGASEFGGDDRFTISGGLGYRFIATDWLALRIDVRDHAFKSDLLGSDAVKHNFEVSGGLTVFF